MKTTLFTEIDCLLSCGGGFDTITTQFIVDSSDGDDLMWLLDDINKTEWMESNAVDIIIDYRIISSVASGEKIVLLGTVRGIL